MTAIALTIAGSDSSGGAGIQADLKTFSALGVYGASVLTALTAQNTRGVSAVHSVPPDFVRAQMDAVYGDLAVDATKIGMLADAGIVAAVADGLAASDAGNIVLDPVMVAASGDPLIDDGAVSVMVERLFPLADLVTPNLHEAARITGGAVATARAEMEAQAERIRSLGARGVYLKGGHLDGEAADLVLTGAGKRWLVAPRVATANTHGTGCTLSSAIAASLAKGASLDVAVDGAKAYIGKAIAAADALTVGGGHGPVHHFHAVWSGS